MLISFFLWVIAIFAALIVMMLVNSSPVAIAVRTAIRDVIVKYFAQLRSHIIPAKATQKGGGAE